MENIEPKQLTYWLLMQVMFIAKHQMVAVAEAADLSVMQFNALLSLEAADAVPMNRLSGIFKCDASNVTGIVDRLEDRGLVSRSEHASDRRIKMIGLTPDGVTLRNSLLQSVLNAEAARLSPVLSEAEEHLLKQLLEKILAAPALK